MSELKMLNFRVDADLRDWFKAYCDEQGRSMTQVVVGWIESARLGKPPYSTGGSASMTDEERERLTRVETLVTESYEKLIKTQQAQIDSLTRQVEMLMSKLGLDDPKPQK